MDQLQTLFVILYFKTMDDENVGVFHQPLTGSRSHFCSLTYVDSCQDIDRDWKRPPLPLISLTIFLTISGYSYYTTLERKFYDAFLGLTDYGACCVMVPYLDFVNNATKEQDSATRSGEDFHSIPYGARYLWTIVGFFANKILFSKDTLQIILQNCP